MSVPPNDVPEPIAYTIDAAESARLRARMLRNVNAIPVYMIAAASFALQGANWLLHVRAYGWNDPFVRVIPIVFLTMVVLAGIVLFLRLRRFPVPMRPGIATSVVFHDQSLEVDRAGERGRTLSVSAVRSVSTTPEAFFLTTKTHIELVIPRRAFVDGGEAFLRFFERRLIAPRMLRRSLPRTTIVNTMTR